MNKNPDLCYCMPGRTGHVHATKITAEEWAAGILAMEKLARDCMAPYLAPLPKAANRARRILAQATGG